MRVIVLIAVLTPFALAGCGNKAKSPPPPDSGSSGGSGGGIVAGGGGGGGGVMAGYKAGKRVATQNELHQIHIFIDSASGASGRMPSSQETLAALEKEAPKIAQAVKEGVIVLHPARSREDVWAYEAVALEQGGQVLTSNGIEKMDAATLKRRLGQ